MLTTFEQVRDWINDNGFERWVLYRDRARTEKILDSQSFPSDREDKLAMTEKYLRLAGGSAYAAGSTNKAAADLNTTCEIRLSEATSAPAAGVGMAQPIVDEDKIAARIEAKLRAEYERKEYERKRDELDKERKAFEEEKASAMGAIAHYFAPIGRAMLGGGMRRVAGVDTDRPTYAQPIHMAPEAKEQEPEQKQTPDEGEIFTEDEANKLFELMARFKKVEPDYLKLIESVVVMAENGDTTYTMAKSFLVK